MERNDRNKIDRNIDQLVSLVDMEKLWPEIKYKIFCHNYPEISNWEDNLNDLEVKKNILLEVKTRGPYAYKNLVNGLRKTAQQCCVNILQNNLVELNSSQENGSSTIKVKKSTRFHDLNSRENSIGTYRMRSNPRGLVLLISLIKYDHPDLYREAAELDEKNLNDLFRQMGFKVLSERNLTGEEIRQKTKEFSQNPELEFVDSAFIIICGHGNMNVTGDDTVVYGIDNTDYSNPGVCCNEIIDYFTPEKCEYLKNKPKIFIFQVCRGEHKQSVVSNNVNKNTPFRFKLGVGKSNIDYSDMFIAHSTLPDCVAYRDCTEGSYFIQFCCEIFAEYACEHHIEDLFFLVDDKMRSVSIPSAAGETEKKNCQTPSLRECHFKKCFINPGLFEDDT